MVCQKNNLLPHSRIFDKMTVAKSVRKFSAFCGTQGLFFDAIMPFKSSPYPHTPFNTQIHITFSSNFQTQILC